MTHLITFYVRSDFVLLIDLQTSVNILYQELEMLREVDHRCCVMESHVGKCNQIFAESEPTEGHVMAEEAMLEEEHYQSDCAGN